MPTNKVVLRTVEQFMSDYVPIYQPLYPLFLSKSQKYDALAAKRDFRRVQTVGDIRAKHITPKDTEMRQVSIMEGKKTFKAYFLANQFTISDFQDQQGVEEVVAQVLDEHQIQADELFLLGEGTSDSTMINNGLFWSGDANYTLETSTEVKKDGNDNYLADFHTKVMVTAQKANQVAGRKVIVFYGSNILPLFNGVFPTAVVPFKTTLQAVLGSDYTLKAMPEACTPSSSHGWLIANLDQTKTHYTVLPQLLDRGVNDEKMYAWFNFRMGSMMLEVLANNAVIRQPATLQA